MKRSVLTKGIHINEVGDLFIFDGLTVLLSWVVSSATSVHVEIGGRDRGRERSIHGGLQTQVLSPSPQQLKKCKA